MEVAERARDIDARFGADGGDALGVAEDRDRSGDAGARDGAIERRQARADPPVDPADGEDREEQQDADGAGEQAEAFGGFRIHLAVRSGRTESPRNTRNTRKVRED